MPGQIVHDCLPVASRALGDELAVLALDMTELTMGSTAGSGMSIDDGLSVGDDLAHVPRAGLCNRNAFPAIEHW